MIACGSQAIWVPGQRCHGRREFMRRILGLIACRFVMNDEVPLQEPVEIPALPGSQARPSAPEAGRARPGQPQASRPDPVPLPVTRIGPARRVRLPDLRELYRYRELFYLLTWRDITVRYKQTVMGA